MYSRSAAVIESSPAPNGLLLASNYLAGSFCGLAIISPKKHMCLSIPLQGPVIHQKNLEPSSVIPCGTDAEPVKQAMIDWRKGGEAALKKRVQQTQSEGELPAEIQPADFARYLSSVMAGLGIQAANGATRAELWRVAEIALRCIESALCDSASG